MAEAVGLIASVATLAEAALKLGKLTSRLKDAPDELFALSNEITELRFLFTEVEKIGQGRRDSLARFSTTLDATALNVEALVSFLQKVETVDTKLKDRVAWLRYKSRIGKLQSELRGSRLQLAALLANAQKFDTIGQPINQSQSTLGAATPLLEASNPSRAASTSVTFCGQATGRQYWSCKCKCHKKSPPHAFSNQLLGNLFLGYSSIPFFASKCSESDCQGRCMSRTTNMTLTYYFPAWVMAKALHFAYTYTPLSGPTFGLAVRNLVSHNCGLLSSAREGDVDGLKSALASGSARLNDSDETGFTALHYAIDNSNYQVMELLLQVGADPLLEDRDGMSALTLAMILFTRRQSAGLPRMCTDDLLFSNTFALEDACELAETHKAILRMTSKPLADVLTSGSSEINATDANGLPPLWWAVYLDDEDSVRILLEHGANPNINHNVLGTSPLFQASSLATQELLLEYGADVCFVNSIGRTIFHQLCHVCSSDLGDNGPFRIRDFIHKCMERGVPLDSRDFEGYTAIMASVYSNYHNLLGAFLECGADYTIRNKSNEGILHTAAWKGDAQTLGILTTHGLPGIDLDARDVNGLTAMAYAVYFNKHKLLEFLLERGADYTIKTKNTITVLHVAANRGDARTMEILAAHGLLGIDLDARSINEGGTALEWFECLKPWKSEDQIRAFYYLWREVSLRARRVTRIGRLDLRSGSSAGESEGQKDEEAESLRQAEDHDVHEEDDAEEEDDGGEDVFVDAPEF
ncbi:ankyrin repeat-containing domain protein [Macrophomina phaseolina]|uniref:Ankyrin repeat-containing domain protein n=1 Tax=Macrophomina phaseolina TaxID=35725 RepID=A0ABQ8GQP8_9PEZI|nr:ankyrin repeat-containing domain protein [Macrophomina phaseolina]